MEKKERRESEKRRKEEKRKEKEKDKRNCQGLVATISRNTFLLSYKGKCPSICPGSFASVNTKNHYTEQYTCLSQQLCTLFFRYCLSIPLAGLICLLPVYFWKVTARDSNFTLCFSVTRILLAVLILKSCMLARENSLGFFFTVSIFFLSWNMLSSYSSYAQLTRDNAELSPASDRWLQLHTFPTVGCCLGWIQLLLDGLALMPCPLMSWKHQPELPGVWVKAIEWYHEGRCRIWIYSYFTSQEGEKCLFEDGPG